jgi:hypothetical protein
VSGCGPRSVARGGIPGAARRPVGKTAKIAVLQLHDFNVPKRRKEGKGRRILDRLTCIDPEQRFRILSQDSTLGVSFHGEAIYHFFEQLDTDPGMVASKEKPIFGMESENILHREGRGGNEV